MKIEALLFHFILCKKTVISILNFPEICLESECIISLSLLCDTAERQTILRPGCVEIRETTICVNLSTEIGGLPLSTILYD